MIFFLAIFAFSAGVPSARGQQFQCWTTGRCQGKLANETVTSSSNGCLKVCHGLAECTWLTWESLSSKCSTFIDCPSMDETCLTCVTSNKDCEENKHWTKLLVATGENFDDGLLQTVEVIDLVNPSADCDLVDALFPSMISGAVGGLLGDKPIICGGYNEDIQTLSQCYQLNGQSWTGFNSMLTAREEASASSSGFNLIVTGGYSADDIEDSSEAITGEAGWLALPPMPVGLTGHCSVAINDTVIIVLGGESDTETSSSNTYFFNLANQEWTVGPPLLDGRQDHSCALSRDGSTVVVAGGDADTLVEVLRLHHSPLQFEHASDMPGPLFRSQMTTDPIEGGVLMIGGYVEDEVASNVLYRYKLSGDWSTSMEPLGTARAGHVALLVPDTVVNCH